jgi:hypothetical protein
MLFMTFPQHKLKIQLESVQFQENFKTEPEHDNTFRHP